MKLTTNRVLAWAVPILFTAATVTFFLLITQPRENASWSSSHDQLATFVGIALIALIPLGTLVYHLAARRSENTNEREAK